MSNPDRLGSTVRARPWTRRALLSALGTTLALGGCTMLPGRPPSAEPTSYPPIVFVHGNGDTAALWTSQIWRFESNGWPRERLHAIDLPHPLARDEDDKPQVARTSSAEHMQFLAGEVDRVLARTGADKVVLVGNSRGGNAIRNYLRNGGGAAKVSHAILGGAPNHGVWARTDFRPGSEFNGTGPFLTALNRPLGPKGEEVTPGVKWMTLRSDNNDKFAQPTGEWIGQPKLATHVAADGPALKGADNVVLAGLDHREVSYHPRSFEQTWRFVLGRSPQRLDILPEERVVLDGVVSGLAGSAPTNLPLAGARVEVHPVSCASGERLGAAPHARTIGADGRWGPLVTRPDACHEFVLAADGYATVHLYRSPFPRSSDVVNMRLARIADADRTPGAVVVMIRPRGYFDLRRDRMSLDGKAPPGVPPGVAGVASSKLVLPEAPVRTVVAEFNGERIAVRSWPAKENRLVFAEMHH